MKTNKTLTLLAALLAVTSLASCGDGVKGVCTYNTYTSVSPSNWNELTYQDENDTQIMSYISGAFFSFDFKFDDDGEILPGQFVVNYDGAEKLEDVTAEYAGEYAVPAEATEQYAYKITLRDTLRWDDGTAITAEDFVYTMKEQLNPKAKHYRADSFYNSGTVINNAKNYFFQGSVGWYASDTPYMEYKTELDSQLIFNIGNTAESKDVYGGALASFRGSMGLPESYGAAKVAAYLTTNYINSVTAEEILALQGKTMAQIKADANLKKAWDAVIGWWQTEPNEELDFFVTEYTWPEVSFDDVGIFVGDNAQELVIVLDKSMKLLNEDGSLYYNAAYQLSSLPVVHKAKWEANLHEPQAGTDLWTSTYNTDVASTASWGPYKLTDYQSGKSYTLEKNPEWYGWDLEIYKDQYRTDRIVCETIAEYNTAMLKFEAGQLGSIGIDVSVADKYKNSSQAIFTPDDFVSSLQLQSSKESLKKRESAGINKTLLSYVDFRKAISLSIDRADYANKCTTSSLAGFGLFNSMHYYDVANGGLFRNTDPAKQVLCDTYGVDATKYESLDEAVEQITGYDLVQARALLEAAVKEAKAAGDYKEGDTVLLTIGTAVDTVSTRRVYDYLKAALENLAKGTSLEGKLTAEFNTSFGDNWANDFRAGAYDICTGGFSGAAWDPGYFLLAYLSPDYMYSAAWDTSKVMMTYKMDGKEYTMSLIDWYDNLNGLGSVANWSDGAVATEERLGLIAALEGQVLQAYYSVPLTNSFSATLMSYKHEYITREYNTFMGYGGLRYMSYNYNDEDWDEYVAKNGLDYKI